MLPKRSKSLKKPDQPLKVKSLTNANLEPDIKRANLSEIDFPVVAVGASAGGLEAFTQFLSELPPDSGIAFVLIQHLDPSHPSSLVELLGKRSPIPITEATEGLRIKPDHAYIIPPGQTLSIHNRTLNLESQAERPVITHSINLFFRSLAEDVKERAVGVILSGTASDGTDGARAIKAEQGLIVVQDPQTAKYDGMPRSAIEAGLADYVLPPEAMPGKLMEYLSQSIYKREQTRQTLKKEDVNTQSIFSLVKARTGRDFSGYKISTISRRIEHRMTVIGIEKVGDYLLLLEEKPEEVENLMKDFLIRVTSFFRDQAAFQALKQAVTRMLQDKPEDSPLRAWIAGCSTGEEAYSIAIILTECMQELRKNYEIQVFGTDLDAKAITDARNGIYPESIVQDINPERLERFFSKMDTTYQIKKSIREKVTFAVHDLLKDPPYSKMDLVSVRNLLIYFDADLQKKVLPLMYYSSNPGGLLFLGPSETIGDFSDLFTIIDAKWRIYSSVNQKQAIPADLFLQPVKYKASAVSLLDHQALAESSPDSLLLLEALPPAIMVDSNYRVVYNHGDTSKYLRMPEGKISTDLLHLVKPELASVLATLIHAASKEQRELESENVSVRTNGATQLIKITARPLSTGKGQIIITFEDLPRPKRRKKKGELPTDARCQQLEEELQRTRDTLRGTIEELKIANEELSSSNEEYMSTNEELKSSNEELETSREELQSVNEELTTLNTEGHRKNEDLATVNNDMKNLLDSTGIATVFLDDNLHIRRFTPAATRLFKFIDADIGRSIEDITSQLKIDSLIKSTHQVLDNLIPVESEIQTTDGKWYSMRILPYRTTDNRIAGVVISFESITRIKATLQYAEDIINNVRDPLLVLDKKLRVISASRAFYKKFQVKPEDTAGQYIYDLGNHQWDIPDLRKVLKEISEKDTVFDGYKVEHNFPNIGHRVMLLNARRIYDLNGETRNILLSIEDITGRVGLEPYSQKKDTQT